MVPATRDIIIKPFGRRNARAWHSLISFCSLHWKLRARVLFFLFPLREFFVRKLNLMMMQFCCQALRHAHTVKDGFPCELQCHLCLPRNVSFCLTCVAVQYTFRCIQSYRFSYKKNVAATLFKYQTLLTLRCV